MSQYFTVTPTDISIVPGVPYSINQLFSITPGLSVDGVDPIVASIISIPPSANYTVQGGGAVNMYGDYNFILYGDPSFYTTTNTPAFGTTITFLTGASDIVTGDVGAGYINTTVPPAYGGGGPWEEFYGSVTFKASQTQNTVHVSIKDAAPVDDGTPAIPGHATFTVTLDHAADTDLSFAVTVNPQNAQSTAVLPFVSAQLIGDISTLATFVVIPAHSTSATFDVNLKGDTQIEPQEQFTVQITPTAGENVIVDKGTAAGTVLGDGVLANNVHADFSQTHLDSFVMGLLSNDLEAAAARIESALGGTVPKFDIQVTTQDLSGPYAKAAPVLSDSIKINGQQVWLPNALAEHLTSGTDPNGAAPDILLTLSTNTADGINTWFSGHSTVDVTTMLTHELLHGLGFGVGYSADPTYANKYQTIWDHFVEASHGSFQFVGPEADGLEATLLNQKHPVPVPLAHAGPTGLVAGIDHLAPPPSDAIAGAPEAVQKTTSSLIIGAGGFCTSGAAKIAAN